MEKQNLVGLFIIGVLKNGSKFWGKCLSVDKDFLYITGTPKENGSVKFITISEIAEFTAKEFKEDVQ
jgi:hypothetical protein